MKTDGDQNTKRRYLEALKQAGLSQKESDIYTLLLRNGQLGVNEILKFAPYKRGNLYDILYSLRDKGIVEQTIKDGKIQFKPKDPYHVVEFIDKEKEKLVEAGAVIQAILPQLFSEYNLTMNRPAVHYMDGYDGIREVYDLMNNSGEKEFLLFRSIYDNDDKEDRKIIEQQKKKQLKLGIKMRLISPLAENTQDNFPSDEARGIERRIVPKTKFMLPAQILVWACNVAIISMKKDRVVTLIENKEIASTFRIIFDYIWESSEEFHNKIVSRWSKE